MLLTHPEQLKLFPCYKIGGQGTVICHGHSTQRLRWDVKSSVVKWLTVRLESGRLRLATSFHGAASA